MGKEKVCVSKVCTEKLESKMPGKHVVGVFADFRREDEGEYVCPRCTIFGLEKEEVKTLIEAGLKLTDRNKDDEGYEIMSSAFKVMRLLGQTHGFEPLKQPVCTDAPGDRKTLVYTLVKEV